MLYPALRFNFSAIGNFLTGALRGVMKREYACDIQLCIDETRADQSEILGDICQSGMYLVTKQRLNINQKVEIAVPTETKGDAIKIKAKVMRGGNHGSWGLFSYDCRILQYDC